MIVTVLLVLISTIAVLYTNKNVIAAQKIATNNYQNSKAAEAAEAGAQAFIAVLQNDLKLLSDADSTNDSSTEVLKKRSPSAATCAGALSSLGALAYEFKFGSSGYASDAATSSTFAADRYFSKTITPPEAITGIAQGLAYRIRASMNSSGEISIQSEGCADNAVTAPTITVPACTASNSPLSLSKRTVNLSGGAFFTASALTVKGYMDATTTFDTRKPTSLHPSPACSILTGDSFEMKAGVPLVTDTSPTGAVCTSSSTCTLPTDIAANTASINTMNPDDYFKKIMGGKSLDEYKAVADKVITNGSCSGIQNSDKVIVFDGNLTDTSCNLMSKGDKIIIVNGAIKPPSSADFKMNGLLFAKDVHQFGSVEVRGVVALGGDWDADTLYMPSPPAAANTLRELTCPACTGGKATNSKANAKIGGHNAAAAAGQGALTVNYDPSKIPPNVFPPSISTKSGSWIDY
ncbi:hypothetical protein [Chitinibacter sp. GC72]|uniref:hypothetical protein n=1 Tax=Chitinibacter sp. GC72 TaxID=1526917 RepID=UPI0012FB0E52|nr:hypothetical protein [Chitinibacter sp. GC72]